MAQGGGTASRSGGIDLAKLQCIEQLVRGLQQPEPGERWSRRAWRLAEGLIHRWL
jgi:hypothetical protein